MKFKISKIALTDGLSRVTHCIPTSSTLPILGNVMLGVSGNRLTLTATDLDIGVETGLELTGDAVEGSFSLPARVLERITKGLPTQELSVELDSEQKMVTVASGKSRFRIMGLKAGDFPVNLFQPHEEPKVITVPQSTLKDALRLSTFAMSDDTARYVLNGLLFESELGSLNLITTDGRRLSKVVLRSAEDFPEIPLTIVPSKTIMEVGRLLTGDGEVQISISEKRVTFSIGDTVIDSKVIEGSYPNYRQVIPGEHSVEMELDVQCLTEVVARVNSIQRADQKSIILDFTENSLAVRANSPDVGDAVEEMDIMFRNEPIKLGLDPAFLLEVLRALGKDCVDARMRLIDSMSPVVLRRGDSFLHVLMPMRVMA